MCWRNLTYPLSNLIIFLLLAYLIPTSVLLQDHFTPINKVKNVPSEIPTECTTAFEKLKELLLAPPCLAYPNDDLPYQLIADASNTGFGAILIQEGRPVAFQSHKFSSAQRTYVVTERELLAIALSLDGWRGCLERCKHLLIISDHSPLLLSPKSNC